MTCHQGLFSAVILPIVQLPEATVDFISTAVLLVLLPMYGILRHGGCWPCPLVVGAHVAGVAGLWLSATNPRYRDVMSALPFAMQVLLFSSPVGYRAS
jgi:lipopolysaccharide transport system permease protein